MIKKSCCGTQILHVKCFSFMKSFEKRNLKFLIGFCERSNQGRLVLFWGCFLLQLLHSRDQAFNSFLIVCHFYVIFLRYDTKRNMLKVGQSKIKKYCFVNLFFRNVYIIKSKRLNNFFFPVLKGKHGLK